jgi:hypothetical protein
MDSFCAEGCKLIKRLRVMNCEIIVIAIDMKIIQGKEEISPYTCQMRGMGRKSMMCSNTPEGIDMQLNMSCAHCQSLYLAHFLISGGVEGTMVRIASTLG